MSDFSKGNWRTLRGDVPVDEDTIEFYGRLIEMEARLEALRARAGVSEADYGAARASSEGDDGEPDDLYRLARCVALLGGRLEVRALFGEEAVPLLLEPEPGARPAQPESL